MFVNYEKYSVFNVLFGNMFVGSLNMCKFLILCIFFEVIFKRIELFFMLCFCKRLVNNECFFVFYFLLDLYILFLVVY